MALLWAVSTLDFGNGIVSFIVAALYALYDTLLEFYFFFTQLIVNFHGRFLVRYFYACTPPLTPLLRAFIAIIPQKRLRLRSSTENP